MLPSSNSLLFVVVTQWYGRSNYGLEIQMVGWKLFKNSY